MKTSNLTFASLFSGIDGFAVAFERAGMECVLQVEIDPNCLKLLADKWPNVKRIDDVRDCHSGAYLDKAVREWYSPENGIDYTLQEKKMTGKLKKLTSDQAAECVKMYDGGLSLEPISDYFGVSRQAMWDLLRRRTTMRPQKRTGRDNLFFRNGSKSDDKAHNILEYALRQGIITRPDICQVCGKPKKFKNGRSGIEAHHPDYNKPLDVMWLCKKCHHEWHTHNTAKRKEVQAEVASADIICGGFP